MATYGDKLGSRETGKAREKEDKLYISLFVLRKGLRKGVKSPLRTPGGESELGKALVLG